LPNGNGLHFNDRLEVDESIVVVCVPAKDSGGVHKQQLLRARSFDELRLGRDGTLVGIECED